ncbi:MAG: GH92 family glycosyl hydrolase [Myxococcales bacterium]|nr:GH92 family glycosyl hydrolase [Myxococcales bacterium]
MKIRPAARSGAPVALVALAVLVMGAGDCNRIPPVPDAEPGPLGQWVDMFMGSGGIPWASGMLSPAATVPFGMVRLGPDTSFRLGLNIGAFGTAGYAYDHDSVLGFSHTRMMGTGVQEGGHFRITPAVGPVAHAFRLNLPTAMDHSLEAASPGYYGLGLPELGVLAEMTATTHVGVHRYTFWPGDDAHLLLDAASVLGEPTNNRADEGWVRVLPDAREVEGSGRIFSSFAGRYGGLTAYFVARFSREFRSFGTWNGDALLADRAETAGDDVGADLRFFDPSGPTVVEVKVAMSYVSLENARVNLEAETGSLAPEAGPAPFGLGFDAVREAARAAWEEYLSRMVPETSDDIVRRIFTTALYRTAMMPTDFTDVTGEYLGFNHTVGVADDFTYRTDISLWDSFRTEHPLLLFTAPDVQRDTIKSLIRMAREGGTLPRWPSGGGYAGSMFGSPAHMVIAESYLKGLTDFEVDEALGYMKNEALHSGPPGASSRTAIEDCVAFGYCPDDRVDWSVSRTLEYAWADAAISWLAQARGDPDAAFFWDRAQAYHDTWNPATEYFQQRDADGSWVEPLIPDWNQYLDQLLGTEFAKGYAEGSPRQYRWTVPQDPQGLIALFGSPEHFVSELETFMEEASPQRGDVYPGSAYWHGNQHDLHALFLFDEAGRPDLAQKWTRWVLTQRYGLGPSGLDGNDDAGTLTSWYLLAGGLGLYPIAGSDRYWVTAPIVDGLTVGVGDAVPLTVTVDNQGPDNVYIQSVEVNGARLCEPWIHHADFMPAGHLHYVLGPDPAPGGGFDCE